ncbi:MAG: hypothetical protein IPM40_06165 [Gammaproteobacteria bacterium]|nr:hypothetical protein [Gammaproteobacteria bacterium]
MTTDIFDGFTDGELSRRCDQILTATRTAMSLIKALPGPPISVVLHNPLSLFTPERHLPECHHDIDEVFRGIEDAVAELKSRARPVERDVKQIPAGTAAIRRSPRQGKCELNLEAAFADCADITNAYFFHDAPQRRALSER